MMNKERYAAFHSSFIIPRSSFIISRYALPHGRATASIFNQYPAIPKSPAAQLARGLDGVVGEDDVGARAPDARQRLQHRAPLVYPAALGGGLDHRVLAGDVVGGEREVETLAHHAQDV